MAWRPHGRATVGVPPAGAWGVCDRCGMLRNHRDLTWQFDWRGPRLMNLRILVCHDTCLDKPQEQLRPRILPPDPVPIQNDRSEHYTQEDGTQPYVGPGDVAPGATAWYGLRGYSNAYATPGSNPAMLLRRPSDNTTKTINILGSGFFDWPTAWNFCAGGPVYVVTLYDQSGNGFHLTQANPTNQPLLVFNALAGAPVITMNGTQWIGNALVNLVSSLSLVAVYNAPPNRGASAYWNIIGGTGALVTDAQLLLPPPAFDPPDSLQIEGGVSSLDTTAVTGRWHAGIGTITSTRMTLSLDGISVASSLANTPSIAHLTIGYGDPATDGDPPFFNGNIAEAGLWPAAFSASQTSEMTANQSGFWGLGIPAAVFAYYGPGDIVGSAFAWYGLRAYSHAVAGAQVKAARLRRLSDNAEQDFTVLASGDFNWQGATEFAAGTVCYVVALYDQSGNARHLTQAVQANQPQIIFQSLAGKPSMLLSGNQWVVGATTPAITEPFSMSVVFDTQDQTGSSPTLFGDSGGQTNIFVTGPVGANQVGFGSTAGSMFPMELSGSWHSIQAVGNDPASYANVDGTLTTSPGTIGTGAFLGPNSIGLAPAFAGPSQLVGSVVEAGLWLTAFSRAQSDQLTSDQHSYWGI